MLEALGAQDVRWTHRRIEWHAEEQGSFLHTLPSYIEWQTETIETQHLIIFNFFFYFHNGKVCFIMYLFIHMLIK